jgi:hypothetical protein
LAVDNFEKKIVLDHSRTEEKRAIVSVVPLGK